jgi:hypothetical protein
MIKSDVKDEDLNIPENEYAYDTPSPYIGKFPKLTSVLNADPTSIDRPETIKRLNTYFNTIPDPISNNERKYVGASEDFRKLRRTQNDVINGYLDDTTHTRNLKELTPKIIQDFGVNPVSVDDYNTQFTNNIGKPLNGGESILKDGDIKTNVNMNMDKYNSKIANPELALFHELRHAYDFDQQLNKYKVNHEYPSSHISKETPEDQRLFLASNRIGSTNHHVPMTDENGNNLPTMLMYPFEKLGYRQEPSMFSKIKDYLKK